MRSFARIFFLVILTAALMPPVPARANAYEILTDYYNGCGSLTLVGGSLKQCDGYTTSYGTLDGHWKHIERTNCVNETVTDEYYENCGGTWYPVSPSAFGGACSC